MQRPARAGPSNRTRDFQGTLVPAGTKLVSEKWPQAIFSNDLEEKRHQHFRAR
jgi:hypothetical protein